MEISRRQLLQVGYSSFLGLGLPTLLAGRTGATRLSSESLHSSKSVIVVFLTGGASHIDTFDPQPKAPDYFRGEFKTIPTRLPDVRFCEYLTQLADRANRLAIVRSMSHGDKGHSPATHNTLTGTEMPLRRTSASRRAVLRRWLELRAATPRRYSQRCLAPLSFE